MAVWTNQETGDEIDFGAEDPSSFRAIIDEKSRQLKEEQKWRAKHEPIVTKVQAEERSGRVTDFFKERGMTPAAASFFQKTSQDDPSDDNLTAFTEEYGREEWPQFYAQKPTEDRKPDSKVQWQGFEPTVNQGPPAPARISLEDFQKLRGEDWDKAMQYRDAGLVDGY